MDTVSGLLDGPRAAAPFLLRVVLDPPWSMHIQDNAPLTLMAVTDGVAWIVPDHGDPVFLSAGDVALVRGTDHYRIADHPDTEPQVIIHPGQICTTLDGHDLAEEMGLGVRTWGNTAYGSKTASHLLIGVYESQPEIGTRFVSALPQLTVITVEEHRSPLVELLTHELIQDGPGQRVILNRLLDLLVISMARIVFERPNGTTPGWFLAQADPIVGPVLTAVYEDPSQPWTVANMAARGGVSRAAFAHRFKQLVGESPIAFLADWRISLAADVLRSTDDTVAAVAAQVGYGTPYAFSTAFKRIKGVSPSEYRRLGLQVGTEAATKLRSGAGPDLDKTRKPALTGAGSLTST